MALCTALMMMALGAIGAPLNAQANAESELETVVVTARSASALFSRAGSVGRVDSATLNLARPEHVHEAAVRIPGVWVSRGSGAEHLTAIRSGVLTGPGACGAFLFLENGIPVRPQGFCNVNNLFEINTAMASAFEVVRGPASAVYGGNGLNGAINVLTPLPGADVFDVSVEGGRWEYGQGRVSFGNQRIRLDVLATHTNGFRDDTGFGEQKLNLSHVATVGEWSVLNHLSLSNLNQETGGFVLGRDAFETSARDTNPNPEAYRDAWSARASSDWRRTVATDVELVLTGYLRRSRMNFLQHFAPGQPLEKNGQESIGLIGTVAGTTANLEWRGGVHFEGASIDLLEDQAGPASGSAFLMATRPVGIHYDFDVDSRLIAAFYDVSRQFDNSLTVLHSARAEYVRYDYDNKASDGNLAEDGTACGFGGCLFRRPGDRDDSFTEASARVGVAWGDAVSRAEPGRRYFATIGASHRPPQVTELYKLQSDQTVADLDSERLVALEIGAEHATTAVDYRIAAFMQKKSDVILRDSDGFIVSNGRTQGVGLEFQGGWQLAPQHELSLTAAYGQFEYDFDRAAARGEVIRDGNDVDTAPRWQGSAHYSYRPNAKLRAELELVWLGDYYVDAANTEEYDGHELVNLRLQYQLTPRVELFARAMNLFDEEYADRADLSFGNLRYFPGEPRRVFVGGRMSF